MVVPYLSAQYQQQNGHAQSPQFRPQPSMDSRPTSEYPPAALSTSNSYQGYPPAHIDPQNGDSSTSTQQSAPQDARSTYSSSATPTSETSAIYQSRTPTFGPDQIVGAPRYVENHQNHRYAPASTSSGDSTVAAPSPAFSPAGHYGSQYPPGPHAMSEGYQQHPGATNPAWRHDWSPYGPAPHQMSASPYGHSPSPTTMAGAPNMVATARPVSAQKSNRKRSGDTPSNHPLSQVYSFVPIPGATQNKRPRRRYEEIERMYKCGWNGCEKAYGTLNHLNAHVTMQGHGAKRTPDEFKEIRKEWKARKKEEEAQRKAAEEEARRRAQDDGSAAAAGTDAQPSATGSPYVAGMPPQRQLPPPLTYQPNVSVATNGVHYSPTAAPTAPMESMQQYTQQPIYTGYAAPPQYGGQPQQMYAGQQRAATTQSNGNTSTTTGGEEPDADAEPDPDVAAAPTYSS